MLELNLANFKRSDDDVKVIGILPEGVTMKGSWYQPSTLKFISKYILDANNDFIGISKDLRKLPSYQDAVDVIRAVLSQVHGITVSKPNLTEEGTARWHDIHSKYMDDCADNGLNTETYTAKEFIAREVA